LNLLLDIDVADATAEARVRKLAVHAH